MNKRIKELALNSGAVPLVGHGGLIISNLNVEKFAELIVQECIGVLEGTLGMNNSTLQNMDAIKEHFGVE